MTEKGRILAIDPGKVRLGLAVSDRDGILASPLDTYTRRDADQDARYLKKLVEEETICRIVIGLPMHTTGTEGVQARLAREFGQWVKKITNLDVRFFDERFTSKEAESALWEAGLSHKQRKARRDRVAAQILLQSYLEAGCPTDQESLG